MGARVLRAVGAAGLVVGAVLMVSGAAWPAPNPVDGPGAVPVPPVLEDVASVPEGMLSEPAHEGGGAHEEGEGSPEEGEGAPDQSSGTHDGDSSAGHHDDSSADHDGSQAQEDSDSRDAYATRTCERILGKPPTGGLDKQTDPAEGSAVSPGDKIDVTITWDPADWSGDSLHKAIDCVTVNDAFSLGLSVEEKPTDNDGRFSATYTIPDDVADGDEICDQGFLSGDSSGGAFEQDRSNQVCFRVTGASGAGTTPAPAPVSPPASPPGEVAPAPAAPAPAPAAVLGEQLTAPVPAPGTRAPAEVASAAGSAGPEVAGATLPRTGQETRRGLVLAGGAVLMLGGFGLISGNRRPRRVRPGTG